jgi:hypothetical protein
VRPDHETTKFKRWTADAFGYWKQKLVPPSDDGSFDFSEEHVQEFAAAPAGPDTCWLMGSPYDPFVKVTNPPGVFWTVGTLIPAEKTAGQNVWGYDSVAYGSGATAWYRLNRSPTFKSTGSCGTTFGQVMGIHAPSDQKKAYTTYGDTNTGNVNTLGASMTATTITSIRSGNVMCEIWPGGGKC